MGNNFDLTFDYKRIFNLEKENLEDNLFFKNNTYFDDFLKSFGTDRNSDYIKMLSNNVQRIIENLNEVTNLLVVGNVQSGKTNNILGLMTCLLTSDFDIILLLGGTTNLLLKQTKDRLNAIKSKNNKFLFIDKDSLGKNNIVENLEQNNKIFFNILKADNDLKKVYEDLRFADLTKKRILIIDDESDFGSVNVGKPESKIYSHLKLIKGRAKNSKLVSFTATPYANILSSKSEELKPDRLVTLNESENYTGLDFFQKNDIYKVVDVSKKFEDTWDEIINLGLKYYVFNSACLNEFNKIDTRSDFIINISLETELHEKIYKSVLKSISSLKRNFLPEFFEDFFTEQILEIDKNVKGFFEGNKPKIIENVKKIVKNLNKENISILNSDYDDKNIGGTLSRIFIGGGLISRGFTFSDLLVQIMINAPQNKIQIDTLLQRARWFGYRMNKYKFMKIVINDQIKKALDEGENINKVIYNSAENNVNKDIKKLESDLKKIVLENSTITGGNKK